MPTTLMSSNVAAAVYCYVAGVPRLINTLLDATLSDAALQKLQAARRRAHQAHGRRPGMEADDTAADRG